MTLGNMEIATTRAPELADWALAHGRTALDTDEIADLLRIPADQVRRRLHAPATRGEWINPAQRLWIPVPPQYRTWGAPPAIEVVDALMRHLDVRYYVGWLSAAALFGSTHQAPQVFQVAVGRHVRDRVIGRSRFEFHHRGALTHTATEQLATPSGFTTVSTVTATALDVLTDVTIAGGLNNAATVAIELSEHPDFSVHDALERAPHSPIATIRRLGWILEHHAENSLDLDALARLSDQAAPSPSRLNPTLSLRGPIDQRWNLSINDDLEVDL